MPQKRTGVLSANINWSPTALTKPRLPAGFSAALRNDRSTGEVRQSSWSSGQVAGSARPKRSLGVGPSSMSPVTLSTALSCWRPALIGSL
ncbi:hypothetical protein D3C72_1634280 [compost metagenome]